MVLGCDKETPEKKKKNNNYAITEYFSIFDGLSITECSFLCQEYCIRLVGLQL